MKCVKRGSVNHVVNRKRKTFTACGFLIGHARTWIPNIEVGNCKNCMKQLARRAGA